MIKKIGLLGTVCLLGLFTFAARAGVIVEGESAGMDKVSSVAYNPATNRFTLNNGTAMRSPLNAAEMLEIVKALRLDDRLGVAAKGNNELVVYGGLSPEGNVVRKLRNADDFLRAVIFGDKTRLQGATLPQGYQPQTAANRDRASAVYFNFDGVDYRLAEGAYWPSDTKAELVLIPMAKQTNPDGSFQPDYDALEKGEMQAEDQANAEHIRAHQEEYLEMPALQPMVKVSQAAAFVRHLRRSGIDLAALAQRLEQGGAFTLAAGEKPAAAPEAVTARAETAAAAETPEPAQQTLASTLLSQQEYSESIKQVLLLDNQFGRANAVKMTRNTVNDGSYVEFRKRYLENIKAVDLSRSPAEFREAYAAHAAAWEKTLNWLAKQNIADTPEAFDAFKNEHAPYRAELGATFRRCKEVAAAYLK